MKKAIYGTILVLVLLTIFHTVYPRELNKIIPKEVMQENIEKIEISIKNDTGVKKQFIYKDEDEIERLVDYLSERKVRRDYSFILPFDEEDEWYMLIHLKEDPVNTVSNTHMLWYNTPNIRKHNFFNPLLFTNCTVYKFMDKVDIEELNSKVN